MSRLIPALLLAVLPALILTSAMSLAGNSPAERLGEAIQFKTVSFQDRSQIDYEEFRRYQAFLKAAYPRVCLASSKWRLLTSLTC